MPIYNIDITSSTTMINGIEAGLIDAGVRTTTHYKDADGLVVTTTLFPKIIRLNTGNRRFFGYIGDSWSSGDATVNERVVLLLGTLDTAVALLLIVSADLIALAFQSNVSTAHRYMLFAHDDAATPNYFAAGWHSASREADGFVLNATSGTSVLDMYSRPLLNASGHYLTSPIIHSQGGVYLGTVVGAKTLHRGISGDAAWWQYGDDIVLNGGRTQSDINYFRNCLLLPDAAAA